jgi:N-methylhydantoinase B
MNPIDNLKFFEKISSLFSAFGRATLLTSDHETLFLKYETLADIGTLPQSAEVSHKYMHLQDGDIVLTNDPYSGGTILSSPTLVLGVGSRLVKGATPAEFIMASRLTLEPQVAPAKTIDEEGLRIPPSPLYIRGEANNAIIDAIKSLPQAPVGMVEAIQAECKRLLAFRDRFKAQIVSGELNLSRAQIKSYLHDCEHEFRKRVEEFREGTGQSELHIGPKEQIKLRAEVHEGHFLFDFAGTSPGESLFMTDSATMGAAIGTVLSILRLDAPLNTGVLSRFEIKAPRGSMVNSAFPRPLYLGHTDGLNLIANAVSLALAQIDPRLAWSASGPSHCSYELRFRGGKVFWDSLPVGGGATPKNAGVNAAFVWRRLNLNESIEQNELTYPMQYVNVGLRANSGGAGLRGGGSGIAKALRLLEDAELAWQFVSPLHKPEGLAGGKSALGPELKVKRADGSEIDLAPTGRMTLQKGDQLIVLSPGGGGFGAPPVTTT